MLHRLYVDTGYTLQQPLGVFDIMFGIYISSLIIVSIQNKLYVVKAAAAIIDATEAKTLLLYPQKYNTATYIIEQTLTEHTYVTTQNRKSPELVFAKIDAFHSIDTVMRVKTEHAMRNTALYLLLIYHLLIQPIFNDQSLDFTSNLFNRAAIVLIHTILLMVVFAADNEAHQHAAAIYLYHARAQQTLFPQT